MQNQRGIAVVEALIAMFIFSLGILALAGMQASLYARNQDARFRMLASVSANELVSVAIADAANAVCYTVPVNAQQNCDNKKAQDYTKSWVADVTGMLPAATDNPPQVSLNANKDFTIALFWQRPQDIQPHSYTLMTRLGS
ncbi:MAG: hypothetical protein K0S11_520 [Gammaproteobacteria bacterium]|nr:hypothetical protein [Gammaproteobacteria bacterium]